MKNVLAVTGTKREAAVLRGLGVKAIAGGGDPWRLIEALKTEWPSAAGIVSFGMAGALDPSLRIGDWVIGTRLCGVIEAECDPLWSVALAAQLPQAKLGICYAEGRLIDNPADKYSLGAKNKALAADMESHIAAMFAGRAGIPFAILRCISDEAQTALPPAIAVAMKPDGGLALGKIAASLAREPRQLIGIAKSMRGFNAAYAALRQGSCTLSGRLAFDSR